MKILFILSLCLSLSACADRGLLRGAVDGDKMVKVKVTEGAGSAWYKPFAEAQAGVDSVVVEETTDTIEGIVIKVQTEKVNVEVIK